VRPDKRAIAAAVENADNAGTGGGAEGIEDEKSSLQSKKGR
jgi:hypothetical protein